MICVGCQPPHEAADCVDVQAGRDRPDRRHCHCQHHPRARAGEHPTPSTEDAIPAESRDSAKLPLRSP